MDNTHDGRSHAGHPLSQTTTRDDPPRRSGQSQVETEEREFNPRTRPHRVRSQSSERGDNRFPRFRPGGHSRGTSPTNETTPILHRDYAPSHAPNYASSSYTQPRSVRYSDFPFGPSGLRRRVGSIQTSINPSRSPGPGMSTRDWYASSRRSVAIAPTIGRDTDTTSRKFSLAGPPPVETLVANQPYVDPGYTQLNPAYDQPVNVRPVWGFAKPLPRVLRPGMVPAQDELQQELEEERVEQQQQSGDLADIESGRVEPTLRPDKIANQLDTIRRERELSLFRAYRQQHEGTPVMSPFGVGRRGSDAMTETQDYRSRAGETIAEEEGSEDQQFPHGEPPHLALSHLGESIANVNEAREEESLKMPYQDAVPLPAYEAEDDEVHNLHTYWSVIRLRFREPFAEFLAVFVQYSFGFTVNLSITVVEGRRNIGDKADWAWGFAAMMAIYIAGGVSGAQLNPALSLMLYVYRGFPLRKIPVYFVGQFGGAFCAALLAYTIYYPGLVNLEQEEQKRLVLQGVDEVASAVQASASTTKLILANFVTFPRLPWVDFRCAFLTEFVGTVLLTVSVLALGDDANAPPGPGMNAFIISLLVVMLGMSLAVPTGLALNPNRDFAPRVAMYALGYGRDGSLFSDGYWFKVAWLGPLLGALAGGFIYDTLIFVGGESPVNYSTIRIRRAARKWRKRWRARIRRTKKKVQEVKRDVVNQGYETIHN